MHAYLSPIGFWKRDSDWDWSSSGKEPERSSWKNKRRHSVVKVLTSKGGTLACVDLRFHCRSCHVVRGRLTDWPFWDVNSERGLFSCYAHKTSFLHSGGKTRYWQFQGLLRDAGQRCHWHFWNFVCSLPVPFSDRVLGCSACGEEWLVLLTETWKRAKYTLVPGTPSFMDMHPKAMASQRSYPRLTS